jgi:Protein of unknown function (DUF2505)
VRDGRMRAETSVVHQGSPMSGAGTALVTPTPRGSRMKCEATVEVKVSLVGGGVERLAARYFFQCGSGSPQFTTEWVKEHA